MQQIRVWRCALSLAGLAMSSSACEPQPVSIFDLRVPRAEWTPGHEFGSPPTAVLGTLLDRGRVALIDPRTRVIRIFDAEARVMFTAEVDSAPAGIARLDSDDGRRVVAVEPDGGRAYTVGTAGALETRALADSLRAGKQVRIEGVLGDGSLLLTTRTAGSRWAELPPGEYRDSVRVLRVGSEGSEMLHAHPGARHRVWVELPFRGAPKELLPADVHATVAGDRIVVAGTHDREWLTVTSGNRSPRAVSVDVPIVRAREADIEAARAARFAEDSSGLLMMRGNASGGPSEERVLEIARTIEALLPHRDTVPAIAGILGDRAGHVWAQAWSPAEADSVTWTRLDAGFEPHFRVVLPSHWRVLDAEGDHMLVQFRDDAGRSVVQVLRVE